MSNVQGLLARVAHIEVARLPGQWPIVKAFGSFAVFGAQVRDEVVAGLLDGDFPIQALARWEREGLW